jgi:hypothetical protein
MRVQRGVLGFCLGREVADVLECLLSGEPAPDRERVDREAEEGDGKDVPSEGEHVARPVEAEQRDGARCACVEGT